MIDNQTSLVLVGVTLLIVGILFWLYVQICEAIEWRWFQKRMEQKNKQWNEKIADAFVKELMKDEKVLAMLKEHAKKIKEENNDTRTND